MDGLRMLLLICRISGTYPLNNRGTVCWRSAAAILGVLAFGSIGLAAFILYNDISASFTMSHVALVLTMLQLLAVFVFQWQLVRNSKDFVRMLSDIRAVRSCKFPASLVFVGIALSSVCLVLTVLLQVSTRRVFAIITMFSSFQNFCIALTVSVLLRSCCEYCLVPGDLDVFRNQHLVFRITDVIMRVFEWPLLLVYVSSLGYAVLMLFVSVCVPVQRKTPISGKHLYYVSLTALKILTLALPCMASQRVYDSMDQNYNAVFAIIKDNPALRKRAKLILYVTTKLQIRLRVCGFFTLDRPLITGMIAGCAANLVILMEFNPVLH